MRQQSGGSPDRDAGPSVAKGLLVLALFGPAFLGLQTSVVAPLASSMAVHFGGGNQGALIAQLAMTFPAIGTILGGPTTAWLLERLGFRTTVASCAALLALSGTAGSYVSNPSLFLTARFVVGLTTVALYTTLVALSGAIFTGATRGRMLSYQIGLGSLISTLAMLLSGFVAQRFGWRLSFLIYAVAAFVTCLSLIVKWPPAQPRQHRESAAINETPAGSLLPLLPYYLVTVGVYVVAFMAVAQGSLLLSANGIAKPSIQSIIIAISTLSFMATATGSAWIEARVTRRWTFSVSLLLMSVGLIIIGSFPAATAAMVGSVVLGAGSGLSTTYLFKLVIEVAPPDLRNRAISWIAPAHNIGLLSNAAIMQTLRVMTGIQHTFIISGAIVAAGALWALNGSSRRAIRRELTTHSSAPH
jgi:MFS family permease